MRAFTFWTFSLPKLLVVGVVVAVAVVAAAVVSWLSAVELETIKTECTVGLGLTLIPILNITAFPQTPTNTILLTVSMSYNFQFS
jgi:hypothetical protein